MRAIGVIAAVAATLALAACDRGGGQAGGEGATAAGDSATTSTSGAAAEATTADAAKAMIPKVRPGKWLISTTLPGGQPSPAYAACITEEKPNEGV